jgi:RHS repeat-associated protein
MRNLTVEQQYSPSLDATSEMTGFTTDINAPYTFSSSLPTQVFKVYAKNNATTNYSRIIGEKSYELNDHLGNFNDTWVLSSKTLSGINPVRNLSEATGIRVVISDRKYLADRDDSNTISTGDNFVPEVLSANEYGAFGSILPGRSFAGGGYRYGFQGQEKDDEVKGEGNSVNYKYRMHDPRIGRFFAVDPLASQYPHNSPYAFSENVVINAVELEGLEKEIIIHQAVPVKPLIFVTPSTFIEITYSFDISAEIHTFPQNINNKKCNCPTNIAIGLTESFIQENPDGVLELHPTRYFELLNGDGTFSQYFDWQYQYVYYDEDGTLVVVGGEFTHDYNGNPYDAAGSKVPGPVIYLDSKEQGEDYAQRQMKKGGGKNAAHKNMKAKEAAKSKYEESKSLYEKLKSTPNKTKDVKKEMEKVKKQMDRNKQKMDEVGETHSRNAKGNR